MRQHRTAADDDLDAAVKRKRIYARYGPDLDAFFRDVQKIRERERIEVILPACDAEELTLP